GRYDRRAQGGGGHQAGGRAEGHAHPASSGRREVLQGIGCDLTSTGGAAGGDLAAPNPATSHDALAADFGRDLEGRLLFWIAVAFSIFQLATAAHVLNLPSQIVRGVHVGFLILLGLPLLAAAAGAARPRRAIAWTLGLLGFAVGLYQWFFYKDL